MNNFHALEEAFWQSISQSHYTSNNIKAYISPVTEVQNFNICYINEGADIQEIINVLNWYNAQSRDCMIICPEGPTHAILQSHKVTWQLENETPTMAMFLNLNEWQPIPNRIDDFVIRLSNDDLSYWSSPLVTAFGSGDLLQDAIVIGQYQTAHEMALRQQCPLYHFALIHHDTPICSLTLTIIDDAARLDDIGTDIHHQGKGYATALIQYALIFAKEQSAKQCVLEASSDGLSVYQKLGFKSLWHYHAYYKSTELNTKHHNQNDHQ
ncbi:GNAT family N-acetyltransferase [Wohlfahrtiimonas larvae]|uniref:GNAT family N-acetyltransferase n=1 Tax=Wohlfahrtiimonas larvae TaxID=1157986 RepID=A0ABP9MC48_9GAMM|nr:GNAT family N-acetyltransferase [Wohlfahrtiimonas larvae]